MQTVLSEDPITSGKVDRDTDVPAVVLDWWLKLARMSAGKRQRGVYLTVAERKIDKWIW